MKDIGKVLFAYIYIYTFCMRHLCRSTLALELGQIGQKFHPLVLGRIRPQIETPIQTKAQFSTSPCRRNSDRKPHEPVVRWFYATDIPNSKPREFNYKKTEPPKKFLPFSAEDSSRIEVKHRNLSKDKQDPFVSVNEDHLFHCNLSSMEMGPIYWEGPIYEIRRGLWFDSNKQPVSQSISDQIEHKFQELKAFEPLLLNEKLESRMFYLTEKERKAKDPSSELKDHGKLVVFSSKEQTAFVCAKGSPLGKFQMQYIVDTPNAPLIGVEKLIRGYQRDKKAQENDESQKTSQNLPKSSNEAMQQSIEKDFKNKTTPETSHEREVDHLIFCVHGIGQGLGIKLQSVNFIHSVNVLRKTLKHVFAESKPLQKLAYSETVAGSKSKNCKVQVLPIVWRHDVEFSPQKPFEDLDAMGNQRLPMLSDITVDALKPLRSLIGDAVLDLLLYYEPLYKQQILQSVATQCNLTYEKYISHHPDFKGKISLVGHSLGSAIFFDILSSQPDDLSSANPRRHLIFDVENYFALGSPLGVFQLLKKQNVGPRLTSAPPDERIQRPKVKNFYNIFHPCDPVSYRLEPLINLEFSKFKPIKMPFYSHNISSQIQDLTKMGDVFSTKAFETFSNVLENVNILKTHKVSHKPDQHQETEEVKSDIALGAAKIMTKMNKNGRVDYALQEGIFDISLLNAMAAHIQYFENEDVAGFLLQELLKKKKEVIQKQGVLSENDL